MDLKTPKVCILIVRVMMGAMVQEALLESRFTYEWYFIFTGFHIYGLWKIHLVADIIPIWDIILIHRILILYIKIKHCKCQGDISKTLIIDYWLLIIFSTYYESLGSDDERFDNIGYILGKKTWNLIRAKGFQIFHGICENLAPLISY